MVSIPLSTAYTGMPSPLGTLWIASTCQGLARIDFGIDELAFCCALEQSGSGTPRFLPEALDGVVAQLSEYFEGRRRIFELPIDLGGLSPFRRAVLDAVRSVPYGAVRSYAQIAREVGKPAAARAVGSAVATNPVSLIVPCHRIIRSDGQPGEYAHRAFGSRGARYKLILLGLEGVRFAG
jgi:methylated-DNA-[protein]-cysteine S-methyltransferase